MESLIDSKNLEQNKMLRLITKDKTLKVTQDYNIYVYDNP